MSSQSIHQPTHSINVKFHTHSLLKNKELPPNVAVYAPRVFLIGGFRLRFLLFDSTEGNLVYE
jgi:hypothetical protein